MRLLLFCFLPIASTLIKAFVIIFAYLVAKLLVGAVLNLGSTRKCFVSGASGASEHSGRQYFFLSRIIIEKFTVLITMCDLMQKILEIVT